MLPLRARVAQLRAGYLTYAIILAITATFVWERLALSRGVDPRRLLETGGLVPTQLWTDPLAALPSLLTAMFLHDPVSYAHVGGNLLFLWVFGDAIEDALGRARYALFFVAAGVCGFIAEAAMSPSSAIPIIGASGAISGVLAAFLSLYPRAEVTVLNPILPLWLFWGPFFRLPAWLVIVEYFLLNLWRAFQPTAGADALYAHLGAFVVGLALVRVLLPRAGSPSTASEHPSAQSR